MRQLATALICCCHKGNNIAAACRQVPELLALLVQEKESIERNDVLVADFKTLADVLIQETVRQDLSQSFPALRNNIHGEESNQFTNSLGTSVNLEVTSNQQQTRTLLADVLNGNEKAAAVLSEEVHRAISLSGPEKDDILALPDLELNWENLGIWIDPIDGTSQYIKAVEQTCDGYPVEGLQVVTVLIGVYDLATGRPLMGVVGRPFSSSIKVFFGASLDQQKLVIPRLLISVERPRPRIVVSFHEAGEFLDKIQEQFEVLRADGAGHKMMMVVEGRADLYINSRPTVYMWDTCGPHSILASLGGGVVTFHQSKAIVYNEPVVAGTGPERWVHKDGIIAYRDSKYLDLVHKAL